jgi:hypothetical protein
LSHLISSLSQKFPAKPIISLVAYQSARTHTLALVTLGITLCSDAPRRMHPIFRIKRRRARRAIFNQERGLIITLQRSRPPPSSPSFYTHKRVQMKSRVLSFSHFPHHQCKMEKRAAARRDHNLDVFSAASSSEKTRCGFIRGLFEYMYIFEARSLRRRRWA